ncbi:MAG: tetratricopeptide repeat protein [Promethearchaeota archaeon]
MIEGPYTLGKIGNIASMLDDMNDFINEKIVLLPVDHVPMILEAIVNSNKKLLKNYFTLGYFGVKKQLKGDLRADLILQMDDLMQWSKREIRNHVRIMKLLDLGQFFLQENNPQVAMKFIDKVLKIDPNNHIAFIAKAGLFKKLGDIHQSNHYVRLYEQAKTHPKKKSVSRDPQKHFNQIIEKIIVGGDNIGKMGERGFYKKIGGDPHGLLEVVMESISFIGKKFQDKHDQSTIELRIIMKDLLFFFSEWLTFVSGAIYYIMEYGFGSDEQVEVVLAAIMKVIGYEKHKDIEDIDENLFIDYERERITDKIQRLENESMNATGQRHEGYRDLRDIDFGYIEENQMRFFYVVDYEQEELRRKMIRPNERVIRDKKITIIIAYPLSNLVKLNIENKKGFTRMDLFRAIYKGYKNIYDEEEAEVGDPGPWKFSLNRGKSNGKYGIWNHYIGELVIERVSYSPSKKIIEMFIGS